jgi:hypothetical protein
MLVVVPMVEVGKVDDNAKEGIVDMVVDVDAEEDEVDEDVDDDDGVGDKVDRTDTDPGKSEDPPPVVNKAALVDRSFTKRFS